MCYFTTVWDFLGHLSTHWDFFNCGLLKHVIDTFQTCSAETRHGRSHWGGMCFLHGMCLLLLPNTSGESSKYRNGVLQNTRNPTSDYWYRRMLPHSCEEFFKSSEEDLHIWEASPNCWVIFTSGQATPFSLAKIKRKEVNPSKADKFTTATIQSDIDDVWLTLWAWPLTLHVHMYICSWQQSQYQWVYQVTNTTHTCTPLPCTHIHTLTHTTHTHIYPHTHTPFHTQ